jgi:cytochrome c-type biogenesis protein CcmF
VAIRKTAREDLYLILAGLDDTGQGAAMKVYINPLQSWLWLGALIVILGTFIVILPKDRERFKAKRILTEGV